MNEKPSSTRRLLLRSGAATFAAPWLAPPTRAQDAAAMAAAVAQFAGGQAVRPGRVKLEIAPLVDNGNVVPMRVRVDSPMSAADHVTEVLRVGGVPAGRGGAHPHPGHAELGDLGGITQQRLAGALDRGRCEHPGPVDTLTETDDLHPAAHVDQLVAVDVGDQQADGVGAAVDGGDT